MEHNKPGRKETISPIVLGIDEYILESYIEGGILSPPCCVFLNLVEILGYGFKENGDFSIYVMTSVDPPSSQSRLVTQGYTFSDGFKYAWRGFINANTT